MNIRENFEYQKKHKSKEEEREIDLIKRQKAFMKKFTDQRDSLFPFFSIPAIEPKK